MSDPEPGDGLGGHTETHAGLTRPGLQADDSLISGRCHLGIAI